MHHCLSFYGFYGITVWYKYSKEILCKLSTAYKTIFRGFFNLDYNNTTLNMLNRNLTPYPVMHRKLLYGFYMRLEKSSNFILHTIFNEMLHTN